MESKEIGAKVKFLREKKGYKQGQLAHLAGISATYIRDIEAGRKNPTVQILGFICNALEITLQQFFMETDDEKENKINQLTADQQILLNEFLKSLMK